MRGPRRSSHQVSIHTRFVYGDIRIGSARRCDIGSNSWITTAAPAFEHSGSGQQLRRMANGCDRLIRFRKVPDDFEHSRV